MSKKFITFAILCYFMVGCSGLFPKKDKGEEVIERSPIKGALLAQVNDWAIGTVDFDEKLDALKTLLPDDPSVQSQLSDVETKKKILQELVNFEILAQEAEDRGLDKEMDVMDAVKNFKRNFLAQKMLGDLYKEITIPAVEVTNFYESNRGLFTKPEVRKIREIVLSTEMEAKNILIRLLQGESFFNLARQYSIAPSKDKGGDLGEKTIDEETIRTEKFANFWKTVVTTDEGKSSSYFKGPEGYYLIKVEKIQGGEARPLSEVREEIKEYLRGAQVTKKKEDIIYNAKQKFEVVVNEDLLD